MRENLSDSLDNVRECLLEARKNLPTLVGIMVLGADDDFDFGEDDLTRARKIAAGLFTNIEGALGVVEQALASLDASDDEGEDDGNSDAEHVTDTAAEE